jgi:hypothetical protein
MPTKILNGLDLQGQRITGLGDPSGATDAATRQYVDNVARGLTWKAPARAAATGNVTVASPGATMDGVTLVNGDRVLLMNQTTQSQNGIYVWNGAATPLTRPADADTDGELAPGTAISVTQGTVNGDRTYVIISDTTIQIGTTAMVWAPIGGGTPYTASNGVALTGQNFAGVVASGGGLTVGAAGFAIDTSVVARKVSGSIGNGSITTVAVTHNLNTKDVLVETRLVATDELVITDWVATSTTQVTFTFGTPPASGAIRFTIMG